MILRTISKHKDKAIEPVLLHNGLSHVARERSILTVDFLALTYSDNEGSVVSRLVPHTRFAKWMTFVVPLTFRSESRCCIDLQTVIVRGINPGKT